MPYVPGMIHDVNDVHIPREWLPQGTSTAAAPSRKHSSRKVYLDMVLEVTTPGKQYGWILHCVILYLHFFRSVMVIRMGISNVTQRQVIGRKVKDLNVGRMLHPPPGSEGQTARSLIFFIRFSLNCLFYITRPLLVISNWFYFTFCFFYELLRFCIALFFLHLYYCLVAFLFIMTSLSHILRNTHTLTFHL